MMNIKWAYSREYAENKYADCTDVLRKDLKVETDVVSPLTSSSDEALVYCKCSVTSNLDLGTANRSLPGELKLQFGS